MWDSIAQLNDDIIDLMSELIRHKILTQPALSCQGQT